MKLAVIGDPVAHSQSPALQRGFLTEAGVEGSYDAIRVPAGEGAGAIADLRARGYRGLNVTTPLKEEAMLACERVPDPTALLAASVNVVLYQLDGVYGFNTDGLGALHAVCEALGLEVGPPERSRVLAGVRIAILGVGPTARAAIGLLGQHGANVSVWNRSTERAVAAAELLGAGVWSLSDVDVVFSALPPQADLGSDVLERVRSTRTVIDANYGTRATLGSTLGRDVIDGASMLRHSALASFRLFSMPRTERPGDGESLAMWSGP